MAGKNDNFDALMAMMALKHISVLRVYNPIP